MGCAWHSFMLPLLLACSLREPVLAVPRPPQSCMCSTPDGAVSAHIAPAMPAAPALPVVQSSTTLCRAWRAPRTSACERQAGRARFPPALQRVADAQTTVPAESDELFEPASAGLLWATGRCSQRCPPSVLDTRPTSAPCTCIPACSPGPSCSPSATPPCSSSPSSSTCSSSGEGQGQAGGHGRCGGDRTRRHGRAQSLQAVSQGALASLRPIHTSTFPIATPLPALLPMHRTGINAIMASLQTGVYMSCWLRLQRNWHLCACMCTGMQLKTPPWPSRCPPPCQLCSPLIRDAPCCSSTCPCCSRRWALAGGQHWVVVVSGDGVGESSRFAPSRPTQCSKLGPRQGPASSSRLRSRLPTISKRSPNDK